MNNDPTIDQGPGAIKSRFEPEGDAIYGPNDERLNLTDITTETVGDVELTTGETVPGQITIEEAIAAVGDEVAAAADEAQTPADAADTIFAAFLLVDQEFDGAPDSLKRELAMTKTKLEEGALWYGRYQQLRDYQAQLIAQNTRAEGNDESPSGLVVVQKPELEVVGRGPAESGTAGSAA